MFCWGLHVRFVTIGAVCALVLSWLSGPSIAGPETSERAASAAYLRADYATAFALIRPLAQHGNARAQVDLAGLYFEGHGVPKNEIEAYRWLRKAADQGFAPGEYFLGQSLAQGAGVPRDHAAAALWLRKSADQGYAPAEFLLGSPLASGLAGFAVPPDPAETKRWLQKAADDGYVPALDWLGISHAMHAPQETAEAVRVFRIAAEQGDATAQEQLGHIYARGNGIPQNYSEALKWYRKAGEQGNTRAQTELARLYARGQGVQKDPVVALMWFDLGHRDQPKADSIWGETLVRLNKTMEGLFDLENGPTTDAQKAQAQRMAAQWLAQHPVSPEKTESPSMWVSLDESVSKVRLGGRASRVKDDGDSAPPASPSEPQTAAPAAATSPPVCTHEEAVEKRIAIQNGYSAIPNCQ